MSVARPKASHRERKMNYKKACELRGERIRDLEAQLAEANAWKAAFMQEHEDWMKIAEGLRNELAEARLKALKAASGAESVHDTKG
jgi:hypothetical protein